MVANLEYCHMLKKVVGTILEGLITLPVCYNILFMQAIQLLSKKWFKAGQVFLITTWWDKNQFTSITTTVTPETTTTTTTTNERFI